jgi:hypothetical protein
MSYSRQRQRQRYIRIACVGRVGPTYLRASKAFFNSRMVGQVRPLQARKSSAQMSSPRQRQYLRRRISKLLDHPSAVEELFKDAVGQSAIWI